MLSPMGFCIVNTQKKPLVFRALSNEKRTKPEREFKLTSYILTHSLDKTGKERERRPLLLPKGRQFMNNNLSLIMFSQLNRNSKNENHSHQLSLPLALGRSQEKPQISSIPGTHQRERHRYRVMLGDELLGDFLTVDQALTLVERGAS